MNLSPKALLVQLLTSPKNNALLDESRRRAHEIISFLETVESEDELPIDLEQLDPAWVAEVYEALSDDDVLSPEEQTQASALEHATESEEERIGRAFKNDLLAHLPAKLRSFHHFRELDRPELTPADWKDLRESTTVRAAGREAEPLLQYGLTPLTVFLATEAVARLSERLLRHGLIPKQDPISFVRPNHHIDVRPALLKSDALMTRITDLTGCEPLTAHCLLSWLLDVALYKPYLFRWFKVSPILEGVRLDQIGDDYTELDERWGMLSEFVAVGERLAAHASNPSTYFHRRQEMQAAIKEVRQTHPHLTSWDLIVLADHYEWPSWAVTCLHNLYISLSTQPDEAEEVLIWQSILSYIPDAFRYNKLVTFCKGTLHKVYMPKESADFVRRLAGYIEQARKNHPFASEISLKGAISDVVYSFQLLAEMQGKTTLARNIDEKRKNVLFESIIPELRPTNSKELIDSLERIALENEAILPELIQQTTVDKKATLPPESKFLVVVENSSFDVLNAFHVEMDIALLEPGMNNILGDTARTSLEQGHAATVQISSAITEKGDFQISLRNEQVFLSPSGSEMSGEQMQDISITHLPRSERRSTPLGFMEYIMKEHHGELNYVPAKEGWSEINLTFPARKLAA